MKHSMQIPVDRPMDDVMLIEINLLLEAIFQRYGYDFREYQRETVNRRIRQFLDAEGFDNVGQVTQRVLRDSEIFFRLQGCFSVVVTSLFRDPFVYQALRRTVLPVLRTWPHLKIWNAGCATGEEAYSMAVLLHEEGLDHRSTIYATDISSPALDTAKAAIYSLDILQNGTANYQQSGAKDTLSSYYRVHYNAGVLDSKIRRNITFARHNLAMDSSFGEMQLIVCRNVLIYFKPELQNQVLEMFWESLDNGGFLCLGDTESLAFTSVEGRFEVVDEHARIYKKRSLK